MKIVQRLRRKIRKLTGQDTDDWRTLGLRKVHFDIVDGCNLKCVGCPNSTMIKKVSRISVADFDRCLRHIDVPHIALFRPFILGEPLLHRELAELLNCLNEQKFTVATVEISTNAQHHDFARLAEAFRTGRVDRLAVSCDGDGTAAEYERLRPPGKWPRLVEFLSETKALRDRLSPKTQLITRTIATAPDDQQRWLDLLQPNGWEADFRDWVYMPGSSVDMTGGATPPPKGLCSFLRDNRQLYVGFDGQVHPCCVSLEAGNFGNLLTTPFSQIVGGAARRNMSVAMKSNRAAMTVCGECPN